MVYGKMTKVKNGKEKPNFQRKYFSLLLWVTHQLIYERKNEEGIMDVTLILKIYIRTTHITLL